MRSCTNGLANSVNVFTVRRATLWVGYMVFMQLQLSVLLLLLGQARGARNGLKSHVLWFLNQHDVCTLDSNWLIETPL